MPKGLLAVVLLALTLCVTPLASAGSTQQTATPQTQASRWDKRSVAAPTRSMEVSGTEVGMYPDFEPGVARYAVTTTAATQGVVTVRASTSDLNGRIRINGRPDADGAVTLRGLEDGDEISVFITDTAGTRAYALVYLPAGFPELDVVTKQPGIMRGRVGLTLSRWDGSDTPNFEVVLDSFGVPAYVWSTMRGSLDLKRQPNGNYSASRPTETSGRTGSAIVELDSAFREVSRYETIGLIDTDGHDSILKADGGRILVGYEDNPESGKVDATIQEVDPDGDVVFTWNSKDYIDPAVDSVVPSSNPDYAHINSIFIMDDGDILASFRHLSQVLKIAWSDHDGYARGDIVWRLGGRSSDFTFVDDPYPGGPCAQHTAGQLPNGNILIFDNGSGGFFGDLCVDPSNPGGPTIGRTQTRITEYALNETDETATLVWDYSVPGRFAGFAGSGERLGNGNTLVGWAAARAAMATEVSPAGEVLWEIRDAAAATEPPSRPVYFTYRALKFVAPDAIDPQVSLSVPAGGATYDVGQRVAARYTCTDRGGSTLRSCGGSVLPGEAIDTSPPGTHTFTVRANDGNGNVTEKVRTYTVAPRYRPDAQIRRGVPGSRFVGDDIYGGASVQRVWQRIDRPGTSVTALVKVQNDGSDRDRLRLQGTRGADAFRIAYFAGTDNVTRQVTSGDFRTPRLGAGDHFVLRVKVTRTRAAHVGDGRTARVRAASVSAPLKTDSVATVVRAAR